MPAHATYYARAGVLGVMIRITARILCRIRSQRRITYISSSMMLAHNSRFQSQNLTRILKYIDVYISKNPKPRTGQEPGGRICRLTGCAKRTGIRHSVYFNYIFIRTMVGI